MTLRHDDKKLPRDELVRQLRSASHIGATAFSKPSAADLMWQAADALDDAAQPSAIVPDNEDEVGKDAAPQTGAAVLPSVEPTCSDAKEEGYGCFRAVRAERLQKEAEEKLAALSSIRRITGEEMAMWLKAWWVNNEQWREEMRLEFGSDIAQHMRGVADMIEQPWLKESDPSAMRPMLVMPDVLVGGETK